MPVFRFVALFLSALCGVVAWGRSVVVADAETHEPLPGASIFDCRGRALGVSNQRGRSPLVDEADFPLTVRYIGYRERREARPGVDTIFLTATVAELPELVIESRRQRVLHILGYVREYSTLATYGDTVSLFREKMVDYMIPTDAKSKFRGWTSPRVLASKSYYRFTNSAGLDSVSSESYNHFSWSDWVGVVREAAIPPRLRAAEAASDTVHGKYSAAEIWTRTPERIAVEVDVLADTAAWRWVPNLAGLFRRDLDFDSFRLHLNYESLPGATLSAEDISGYSFNIESRGRGHDIFCFHRDDEPYFVNTYAEVHVLDKEYITPAEARRWQSRKLQEMELDILRPADMEALDPAVEELIARVEGIDREAVRLARVPDARLGGIDLYARNRNFNIGVRALNMLKYLTGISAIASRRNDNRTWREFRGRVRKIR